MAEQENMVYAVFFCLAERILHAIQIDTPRDLVLLHINDTLKKPCRLDSKLSVASVARAQSRVGTTQCHCPDIRSEERCFRD